MPGSQGLEYGAHELISTEDLPQRALGKPVIDTWLSPACSGYWLCGSETEKKRSNPREPADTGVQCRSSWRRGEMPSVS